MPSFLKEGMTHMVAIGNDPAGVALDTAHSLTYNLFAQLEANGFTRKYANSSVQKEITRVIYEPTAAVDPLIATDPWRIQFEVTTGGAQIPNPLGNGQIAVINTGLNMKIGSPSQLPDNGDITAAAALKEYPIVPTTFVSLSVAESAASGGADVKNPRISVRHPMSYRLTIADRGFVLGAWTQAITESTTKMGVVCVQRGVGCDGTTKVTGQKPLYMVTNVTPIGSGVLTGGAGAADGPRNQWYYSIIRESDTSQSRPGWLTSTGSGSPPTANGYRYNENEISNPAEPRGQVLNYFPMRWEVPVTTDSGEYVLIFPFGLCSNRFAFSEEIDLLAVSKADAYQSGQDVEINVYDQNRVYTAYSSNNNLDVVAGASGVRIFLLTGGDINAPTAPPPGP